MKGGKAIWPQLVDEPGTRILSVAAPAKRPRGIWFFSTLEFGEPRLFDLEADPECRSNVAERLPGRCAQARDAILADAGGDLVHHEPPAPTDAIGRREPGKR